MKHLIPLVFAACISFTAANAQEAEATTVSTVKKLSSDEKEAIKAKKESDLKKAFRDAGVTSKEEKKARVIMDDTAAMNKELKNDDTLTPEEIKSKSKENTVARDAKLKELFGDDTYKKFKAIQKSQKEALKSEMN